MRPPLRPGTWRGGLVTLAGVLPVSLLLNLGLAPALGRLLPHILVVGINAVVLVAVLNWLLLPLLHWTTKGWALPRPAAGEGATPRSAQPRRTRARAPRSGGRRRASRSA